MKFTATPIADVWVIDLDHRDDDRGSFSRAFCVREFREHGIEFPVVQSNLTTTARAATLRGMHYQVAPAAEAKLMRCVRGAVHDVLVDVRPDSPTYLQHFGVELSAANGRALYVPPLCAHGYLSLTDDCDVLYLVSEFYAPGAERGARFDDPAFAIKWPMMPRIISEKDLAWDPYEPSR